MSSLENSANIIQYMQLKANKMYLCANLSEYNATFWQFSSQTLNLYIVAILGY